MSHHTYKATAGSAVETAWFDDNDCWHLCPFPRRWCVYTSDHIEETADEAGIYGVLGTWNPD